MDRDTAIDKIKKCLALSNVLVTGRRQAVRVDRPVGRLVNEAKDKR